MNDAPQNAAEPGEAHLIVVGNEKGGTGKSTTAMHLIVALIRDGYSVASIDLDSAQGTLSRYMENRRSFAETKGVRLPVPEHHLFERSDLDNNSERVADEVRRLDDLIKTLSASHNFIVIDCPGTDNPTARHAISLASTLITPVNDSFIDIDLLAKVGGSPPKVLGPSRYSQIIWEQRQERAKTTGKPLDWIVLRNRLSPLESRNKKNVGTTLEQLAKRIGFRLIEGFYERVIFRQLFLQGLTVLDLRDEGTDVALNLSHVAARREIRRLVDAVSEGGDESGEAQDEPANESEAAPAGAAEKD